MQVPWYHQWRGRHCMRHKFFPFFGQHNLQNLANTWPQRRHKKIHLTDYVRPRGNAWHEIFMDPDKSVQGRRGKVVQVYYRGATELHMRQRERKYLLHTISNQIESPQEIPMEGCRCYLAGKKVSVSLHNLIWQHIEKNTWNCTWPSEDIWQIDPSTWQTERQWWWC